MQESQNSSKLRTERNVSTFCHLGLAELEWKGDPQLMIVQMMNKL